MVVYNYRVILFFIPFFHYIQAGQINLKIYLALHTDHAHPVTGAVVEPHHSLLSHVRTPM